MHWYKTTDWSIQTYNIYHFPPYQIPGEQNISEVAMAGKKSIDTMKAVRSLSFLNHLIFSLFRLNG